LTVVDDFRIQFADFKGDTQRQFIELRTFMLLGFGILFGGFGILMGFILWDRRTVVAPVKKQLDELKEENEP